MPHVQLSQPEDGTPKLIVDGVDMTDSVQRTGFSLTMPEAYSGRFMATITLVPTVLEVDLPNCIVKVIRVADGSGLSEGLK